jgi:hypothetical protein
MKSRIASALGIVIILALASVCWASPQLIQGDQGDRFHWTGKLPAEKVVEIKNVNGEIEVEGVAGDQIEINAVKSGRDRDQVKVELIQTADGITVCAVLPGNSCESGSNWSSHSHGDHQWSVDFTVRVPKNLRVTARNVNGKVRAEDLGRYVDASSVNGSVDVTTASYAKGSSVNGGVHLRMGRTDWPGTLKISSVNGSIEVDVPADLNADVRFSSVNGSLDTDFPLTIEGHYGFGPKNIRGRIGNGGRELEVSTVNGSLHIRKGGASGM